MQYKTNKGNSLEIEEGLEYLEMSSDYLPYTIQKDTRRKLTINLDEPIKSAKYYRLICDEIETLDEGDIICTKINSPGGLIDGAIALMHAIRSSPAEHECVLVGEASSAASFFPMIANRVQIGLYSTMLIHTISFGAGGKVPDVFSTVEFTKNQTAKFMKEVYLNFLSPDEIKSVLEGKELFLTNKEITQKFKAKNNINSPVKNDVNSQVKSKKTKPTLEVTPEFKINLDSSCIP